MCVSRALSLLLLATTLAGCATTALPVKKKGPDPMHVAMYGPHPDERFPLPAMDISRVNPKYFRQQVAYQTMEPAGTIVIDTQNRFLYLVQGEGMAMRYGIGVGKAGLEFEGTARIGRKAEWPRWTPTANMMRREERYRKLAGGLEGGPWNPLGARAVYLYRGGNDTHFRIHGTNQPESIGLAMSSGCVRMLNHDIIDLYERINVGDRVVVIQA